MKRGTIRHPKLLRLARRLNCRPYVALGALEALLDWAYTFARRGDVGHFADEDIAEAVGWDGDAGTFVAALVETRWLDRCTQHRLVIHDLADHADRTWKQALDRAHTTFVSPQCVLSEYSLSTHCDTLKPPARPEPEPEPEPEEKKLALARKEKSAALRAKPKTAWPEDFVLTPELAGYATRQGLDAAYQWGKFKAHAQQDDRRHVNWIRAWEYWVRNAWEIERRHG